MGELVVTFKLEEKIYSGLRDMTNNETIGNTKIVRQDLTNRPRKKNAASACDYINFNRETKEQR